MDTYSLFWICIVTGISCVSCNKIKNCPGGTFQPEVGSPCTNCSKCPGNQVVLETCYENRDTVCGPFTGFKPFYQGQNNKLHSDDVAPDRITEHEADDSVTTSWQTASTMMIILLAVISVLCVVLIVTVWYRCRRDKKDGLMIYVEKDSEEIQAMPGCSSTSATGSDSIGSAHAREPELQPTGSKDTPGNGGDKQNKTKIHQFEITEGSETT